MTEYRRVLGLGSPKTGLAGAGVPVEEHLGGENGVERPEAGDQAVEDELVVDLLEGGEMVRGAEEVVEDLGVTSLALWFLDRLCVDRMV